MLQRRCGVWAVPPALPLTRPRRAPEQGFELFMDDKPMIPMMSLNDFAEIEAGKTVAIVLKRK